jgi:hypothetical protein
VSGGEPDDEFAAADVVRSGEDVVAEEDDDCGADEFGGGDGGNEADDAAEELAMGVVVATDCQGLEIDRGSTSAGEVGEARDRGGDGERTPS